MMLAADSAADGLWAITTYFNPMRYRRRLSNYRIFRRHLKVPLVAVELSYGDQFDLQQQDADILVRLRGGAVLWQKERLLNLALRALPATCRKVAWLDCDIIFRRPDWAGLASTLLDRAAIVQLFKHMHQLPADWIPGSSDVDLTFSRPSVAYSLSSGVPAAACVGNFSDRRIDSAAPGLAWAARREILEQHGFFDACIVGGGDRAMACAAHHCFKELMECHYMNEQQRRRYLAWAEPYYDSVRGEAAFVDTDILHLWHGHERDRAARSRHHGLQAFRFDPFNDIAIEDNGSWVWQTDKPDMHAYVRGYFSARREDG
jgi:hypothetical protein